MGEDYGEDNREGACEARRRAKGKDDSAREAENHLAHRC